MYYSDWNQVLLPHLKLYRVSLCSFVHFSPKSGPNWMMSWWVVDPGFYWSLIQTGLFFFEPEHLWSLSDRWLVTTDALFMWLITFKMEEDPLKVFLFSFLLWSWTWTRSQFCHGAAATWRQRALAQPPQRLQLSLHQNLCTRLPCCITSFRQHGLLRPPAGGAGGVERHPDLLTDLQTIWKKPKQTGALWAVPGPPEAGRQRWVFYMSHHALQQTRLKLI